jgi:site-specific DNA-cytosine methylase
MRALKVISLFDGMSCGALALDEARVPLDAYAAAEIDKPAMAVGNYTYPHINHVGDVCELDPMDYKDYDLIIGGSPCQSISMAGGLKGMTTSDGQIVDSLPIYLYYKDMGYGYDKSSLKYFHSSCLFWEYVRIYRGIKLLNPEVKFLLENVVNAYWGELISGVMGVEPIRINSSVVSAQNRDRYYWTNIEYTPIQNHGSRLSSIIPDAVAGAGTRGIPQKNWSYSPENPFKHIQRTTVRKDGLANCLTVGGGDLCRRYMSTDGSIKPITIEQAELLQTVPAGYTDVPGISEFQRFKMLGNGWTVDVIAHFFRCLKLEFERKETVQV